MKNQKLLILLLAQSIPHKTYLLVFLGIGGIVLELTQLATFAKFCFSLPVHLEFYFYIYTPSMMFYFAVPSQCFLLFAFLLLRSCLLTFPSRRLFSYPPFHFSFRLIWYISISWYLCIKFHVTFSTNGIAFGLTFLDDAGARTFPDIYSRILQIYAMLIALFYEDFTGASSFLKQF